MCQTIVTKMIDERKMMNQVCKKYRCFIELLMVLCIYALVWILFGVRYEVNDDAILSNIAAGAYGRDTQYLVYINILIGWFLKPFFTLFPGLNWLYLLQSAAVVAALTVLCHLIVQEFGLKRGIPVAALVLCVLGIDLFYSFQYVKNSGICLIVGFLLMAKHLGKWNSSLFLGMFFVVFGSMLRFQNFLAVGALSAALLLVRFFPLPAKEKKTAICSFMLMIGLVFAVKVVDFTSYQVNDGWRLFTEYNVLRSQISDFRLQFLQNPQTLEPLGYSANDVDMLNGWFFWDNDVFSTEQLGNILQVLPRNSIGNAVRELISHITALFDLAPLHLLLCVICLLWLVCAKKRRSWGFAVTMAMFAALLFYLSYQGRYPHRVDFVLVSAAALFGWQCCEWKGAVGAVHPRTMAVTLCLFALVCLPNWNQNRINMKEYAAVRTDVAKYHEYAADKENLYLLDIDVLDSISGYDVLRPRPEGFFSNMVFLGGWLSKSPLQTEVLRQYDIQNPYKDMVNRRDVYLIDYTNASAKEIFLQEHYDEEIYRVVVEETPVFWTYQMRT